MKTIAGSSSIRLAHDVCRLLNVLPVDALCKRFSDGELSVHLPVDLSGKGHTYFLVHSLSDPVNTHLVMLLLTIETLRRKGACKIIVCIPYLAYARDAYKASLIVSLIQAAGAHRCVIIDPHSLIESKVSIDVLSTAELFADHIKSAHSLDNLVVAAPDQGGIERCERVRDALKLKSDLIRIDKIRAGGICAVQEIHGDVKGKRCIIIDDIVDTGTTLCSAAEAMMQRGAIEVFAYCTHAVLSGEARDLLQDSCIKRLVITDTIAPKVEMLTISKIEVISVAGLIAKHIKYT